MSAKTTAISIVLIAFATGLFVGAAGDRAWLFSRHRLVPERSSSDFVTRMVERLDHELNLNAAQRAQITTILEIRKKRVDELMSSVRPQVRQQIDATDAEIARLLTPDQRKKFDELMVKKQKRRERTRTQT
jgi:Spy/CpxP family protein refolding chaperone